MKPCPRKVSPQITVWAPSDTSPIFQYIKGPSIHKRNTHLYAPGLCSVLFSMYCTTEEAYKNGASVYICMCGVVKISCKWECNTGLWIRCQDYFLLFEYLTFLYIRNQFIIRSNIFQSGHGGARRDEGSLRLWTRHPEYNVSEEQSHPTDIFKLWQNSKFSLKEALLAFVGSYVYWREVN